MKVVLFDCGVSELLTEPLMHEVAQTSLPALFVGLSFFALPPIIKGASGSILFGPLELRTESFIAERFELELLRFGSLRVALVVLFELTLLLSEAAAANKHTVAILISRLMKWKDEIFIFDPQPDRAPSKISTCPK